MLRGLGLTRALVVHGEGLDDFTVSGPTKVSELKPDGAIVTYVVAPEDVGLARHPLDSLGGGDAVHNAAQLRGVLASEADPAKRDVVLFNAGAALYLAERAPDLRGGVALARAALESGAALAKLDDYLDFSRAAAGRTSARAATA